MSNNTPTTPQHDREDEQERLLGFLSDPETIKKAVEGSIDKRLKVLAQHRDELINDLADYHLRRLQEQHPIDTVETLGPVARDIATAQLTAYVAAIERQADRRTLETIAALLNGDDNQVDVVKGYVRNKLEMYAERGQLRTTQEADKPHG